MRHLIVRRSTYQDSFNLMLISSQVRKIPGVKDIALFMGTEANKKRLQTAGYEDVASLQTSANDLLIAFDVDNEDVFKTAHQEIDRLLTGDQAHAFGASTEKGFLPRSLDGAIKSLGNPNLVSISLPGEYSGREAKKALENNLHVFLFSDNVSFKDEIELKKLAQEKGLLMMGPDCGTARIGQHALGFCNYVISGEVGVVAASGSGAQEVICLLDRVGVGISHILGTGGRDLDKSVGAVTSKMGLCALEKDASTKIIIYISKPTDAQSKDNLIEVIKNLTKPVIICFIGEGKVSLEQAQGYITAGNLHHTAQLAADLVKNNALSNPLTIDAFRRQHKGRLESLQEQLAPGQQFIRGLYSGGSLVDEAAHILALEFSEVYAGKGFGNVLPIQNWEVSSGHTILDLGDDRFTQGKPHPMIDFHTRITRLHQEAKDPSVAVILLDVILGSNAHQDPAEDLIKEIVAAKTEALNHGRALNFFVHVCGTDRDPQNYSKQMEEFEQAGCWVFGSNLEASFAAACLVSPTATDKQSKR